MQTGPVLCAGRGSRARLATAAPDPQLVAVQNLLMHSGTDIGTGHRYHHDVSWALATAIITVKLTTSLIIDTQQ